LVKNPDIILADEPTGSLHYEIGDAIIRKLIECTKGKLLIMVSHDTRMAGSFDVVIDIKAGGGNAHD
jgi:putative ABC transport system ATP-binding protein